MVHKLHEADSNLTQHLAKHHFGLFPNESEDEAQKDALFISEISEGTWSGYDIEDYLEGHSPTYIELVLTYLDEIEEQQYY